MGVRDEDTVSSLAGRLARLNKQLDEKEQARITEAAGGVALTDIVGGLISAIDPDRIEEAGTQGRRRRRAHRSAARPGPRQAGWRRRVCFYRAR